MKQSSHRSCHKCAQAYDYVDVASYIISLSGFLRCRYCGYHNRLRPKAKTWHRRAISVFVFLLVAFIVFMGVRYYFSEAIKPTPLFSDTEAYKNTEHYALNSEIYENKTAIGLAGLKLLLLICLPAFILSRWCLNIIFYLSGSK